MLTTDHIQPLNNVLLTMSQSLSLPSFDGVEGADNAFNTDAPTKFPHTRAQLQAIARQHRDSYDSDAEVEDQGRVDSSMVTKVVALLDQEDEEHLKSLLKDMYTIDNETVRDHSVIHVIHC